MVWNRYGDRSMGKLLLHYDMAATLTHHQKSMVREDFAGLLSGEDTESTQLKPPFGSHTLLRASAS